MRVYLIGYMASGKSWLGKELASAKGWNFIDLDELFEARYRLSILDFFDKYGESLFRRLEQKLLHETLDLDEVIISTGGGTPCFFDNMDFILRSGVSIYLQMEIPELLHRIIGIKKKRPLLRDVHSKKLDEFIRDQLTSRMPYYTKAHYIFQGPDYPVDEIVRILGSVSGGPDKATV